MYTIEQISAMSPDEKANLDKMIARKLAFRVAGFVFFKIAATRVLSMIANRSYQSEVTSH